MSQSSKYFAAKSLHRHNSPNLAKRQRAKSKSNLNIIADLTLKESIKICQS
jgi:hypothetical protein